MSDSSAITGEQWVAEFAAELDLPTPDMTSIETLLELAGEAAHDSERIAAPIACWLVGVAGLDLTQALEKTKKFVSSRKASS